MHRFNHCLLSIARKADRSEAERLAKRIAWTSTVDREGPAHCGMVGTLPPKVDYDAEEGIRLFVRVGLEFGMDQDNECRGHGGKEASLSSNLAGTRPCDTQDSQISRWCSDLRHTSS